MYFNFELLGSSFITDHFSSVVFVEMSLWSIGGFFSSFFFLVPSSLVKQVASNYVCIGAYMISKLQSELTNNIRKFGPAVIRV